MSHTHDHGHTFAHEHAHTDAERDGDNFVGRRVIDAARKYGPWRKSGTLRPALGQESANRRISLCPPKPSY